MYVKFIPAVLLNDQEELTAQQFVGGFKGDWEKVPSGQNQVSKLKLLADEGVKFDAKGKLVEKWRWWDDFDLEKL